MRLSAPVPIHRPVSAPRFLGGQKFIQPAIVPTSSGPKPSPQGANAEVRFGGNLPGRISKLLASALVGLGMGWTMSSGVFYVYAENISSQGQAPAQGFKGEAYGDFKYLAAEKDTPEKLFREDIPKDEDYRQAVDLFNRETQRLLKGRPDLGYIAQQNTGAVWMLDSDGYCNKDIGIAFPAECPKDQRYRALGTTLPGMVTLATQAILEDDKGVTTKDGKHIPASQDGWAVVPHEMMHVLDLIGGETDTYDFSAYNSDGIPPGLSPEQVEVFKIQRKIELEKLVAGISPIRQFTDSGYYKSKAYDVEFLAHMAEAFLEKPEALQKSNPILFDLMKQVLNLDPITQTVIQPTDAMHYVSPRTAALQEKSRHYLFAGLGCLVLGGTGNMILYRRGRAPKSPPPEPNSPA